MSAKVLPAAEAQGDLRVVDLDAEVTRKQSVTSVPDAAAEGSTDMPSRQPSQPSQPSQTSMPSPTSSADDATTDAGTHSHLDDVNDEQFLLLRQLHDDGKISDSAYEQGLAALGMTAVTALQAENELQSNSSARARAAFFFRRGRGGASGAEQHGAGTGGSSFFKGLKSRLVEGVSGQEQGRLLPEEGNLVQDIMARASTDDQFEALRFLRAYRDVSEAAGALLRAQQWRKTTMAPVLENPAPLVKWLARGHTQLLPYGTKDGHPIVVIDMLEDVGDAAARETHALASLFVIEKAIACCDDPMAAIDIIVDRTQLNQRAAASPDVRARTTTMYDSWHAYYPMRIRRLHIYPPGAVLAFSEHKLAQASAKGTWERSHASAAQLCKLVGKRNLPRRLGGAMAHEFNVSDVLLPKLKLRSYFGSRVQLRFSDCEMQERFEQWAGETSSAHRWRNIVMTAIMVICTVIVTGLVRHSIIGCEKVEGFAIFGVSYILAWFWYLRWASKQLFSGDFPAAARKAAMLILILCGLLPIGRAQSVATTHASHPLCRPRPLAGIATFSQGDPATLTALVNHLGLPSQNMSLTVVVEQVAEMLVFLLYMQLLSAMNLPFDVFVRWVPIALILWAAPSFVMMSRGEDAWWIFQGLELLFALAFTSMQMKESAETRERFKAHERQEQVLALAQEEAAGLRTQTENTPMVTVDASLVVSVWNDAMENLTGWRAQDVIGRSLIDKLVAQSSRRAVKHKLEALLTTDEAHTSKDSKRSLEIPMLLRHAAGDANSAGTSNGNDSVLTQDKAADGLDEGGTAYAVNQVASVSGAYDGGHAGSETVMLLCTTALRADASGAVHGIALLAQDITERVRLEEARKTFVASFSHELRTPLTGIMGMLELLAAEALSSDAQRYVDKARVSSNLLLNLINDILDMSRIEAGKMQLGSRPFKVQRTVEGTLDLVRYQASSKKLSLKLVMADDVPAYVRGDVLRFRQVILNLLSNAVKFTTRGTITVSVRNEDTHEEGDGPCLRVAVRDTGIGIPEAQQNGLFHMFSKLDQGLDQAVANASGCGLGLAICARLVSLMQGVIEAKSTEGKGSTFAFTCKFGAVTEAEAKSESSKSGVASEIGSTATSGEGDDAVPTVRMRPKDTARTIRGRRVLLAEDNAFNAEIIVSFLNAVNVQVTWTSNGSHALELFTRAQPDTPFDVVLMDCQMPVMNGWEATRAIRAWEQDRADQHPGQPRVPVIALTAYAMDEEQKKCLSAGMDVVVTKPVTRQRLVDVIAHLVADSSSGGSDSASSTSAATFEATAEIQRTADAQHAEQAMTASLSASLNVAEVHSPSTRSRVLGAARLESSASGASNLSGSDRSRHKIQLGSSFAEQAVHERQRSMSREFMLPAHVTTNGNTAAMLGNASPNTHLLPIDEDLGLAQFGNRQMYMRMMSKFAVNYLPAGVRAITTANKDGDIIALRMEAHSLKGSAAFVGAMALADVCSRLMAACGIEGGMSQWQQKFVDAACQQVKAEFDMLNAYFESKHKFTLMDGDGADDGTAFASQMLEFEGDKGDAEMVEHLKHCRGRKVLIVEDDPFTAEVLLALVQGAGMSATHCGDGKAGVAMYISDPSAYDVVVMDCIMPGQSGSKSAQTIRAWEQKQTSPRYRRVPIVGLSAYRQHEQGCKEAGMDTFVVKPIGRKSLLRLIARLVQREPRQNIDDASDTLINRICKVNIDLGVDQYESSENYRKVLRQFTQTEVAERYDAICKAAEGEHWGMLHLAAHSLKGSSGMVYATGMNEICLRLHRCCTSDGNLVKDATTNEVLRLVQELGRECEMLREYCGVARTSVGGSGGEDSDASGDGSSAGSTVADALSEGAGASAHPPAAAASAALPAASAPAFVPAAAEAPLARSNAAQTLGALEEALFGQAQTGAMLMRVVALEDAMLGSAQTGPVQVRITALKDAILG